MKSSRGLTRSHADQGEVKRNGRTCIDPYVLMFPIRVYPREFAANLFFL